MITPKGAQSFFKGAVGKLDDWVNPGEMDSGKFLGDVAQGAFSFLQKNPKNAALGVGAVGGAAGGVISNDRDQHWYTGAAQGAFTGSMMANKGLSGRGMAGAALGAMYGMASDDTSIMTGAMMGASMGAGARYFGAAKKAYKFGDTKGWTKQRGKSHVYRDPKSYAPPGKNGKATTPKAATKRQRAGWGLNAAWNAAKRDVGAGWKVGKSKSGGTRTNRAGQQHRKKQRAGFM
jgi:hypothetical protein